MSFFLLSSPFLCRDAIGIVLGSTFGKVPLPTLVEAIFTMNNEVLTDRHLTALANVVPTAEEVFFFDSELVIAI